jgi:hypothetical protein
MNVRSLALVSAFALALPVAVNAQHPGAAVPRQPQQNGGRTAIGSQAFNTGYDRGWRVGEDDGRQNRRFDYASKSDYRNADYGYNRNYGDRERWRSEFRTGFESGYREGFSRYSGNYGGYGNGGYGQGGYGTGGYGQGGYGNGGYGSTPPPWANGRGRGRGNGRGNGNGNGNGSWQRNDLAYQNGFTDGYEAGMNDGHSNRRFDPVNESRYRSGDRGYKNTYGTRDAYRFTYRDAFREGYEYGYQESVRMAGIRRPTAGHRGGRGDDLTIT